jgi:rhodanese-related sulfurtransferase
VSAPVPLAVEGWQLQCGEIQPSVIVDIRQPEAFAKARMASALNIPYEQLQARGLAELTGRGHVLVVDPGGARAAEMAVWLRRHGVSASYLVGGYAQWTGPLDRT